MYDNAFDVTQGRNGINGTKAHKKCGVEEKPLHGEQTKIIGMKYFYHVFHTEQQGATHTIYSHTRHENDRVKKDK